MTSLRCRRNRRTSRPPQAHPGPERLQHPPGTPARPAGAQPTTRDLERTFDLLNPDYGVPADPHNHYGHQAVREREAALSLGTRVAVAASRENDRNPVMWLAGQDYRAADAIHTARTQPTRTRWGPERVGPER